jgi:nucleotide-binding universal stress UspA family protein
MFDRILVTTDGSPLGNLALPYAADLARHYSSALTVLYVVPSADTPLALSEGATYAYDFQAEQERLKSEGENILEQAREVVNLPGTRFLRRDSSGPRLAQMIVNEADQEDAQLVVMSTHGRSGLAHLFLGSVAEEVLRKLRVPVFLVREQARAGDVQPGKPRGIAT